MYRMPGRFYTRDSLSPLSMVFRIASLISGKDVPRFELTAGYSRLGATPTLVLFLIAAVIFLRSVYYRYLHPLSKVPGIKQSHQVREICRAVLSSKQVHSWHQSLEYGTFTQIPGQTSSKATYPKGFYIMRFRESNIWSICKRTGNMVG